MKNNKRIIIRVPDKLFYNLKALEINVSEYVRLALENLIKKTKKAS